MQLEVPVSREDGNNFLPADVRVTEVPENTDYFKYPSNVRTGKGPRTAWSPGFLFGRWRNGGAQVPRHISERGRNGTQG